ncbi:MAG: hypothetical protein JNM57_06285 [Cyclobacteriaceae bacterium]|nr:hypothetical protein [Cyclobacteriaceae bacterium]
MRKVLFLLLALGAVSALVAYQIYNKPHRHAEGKPYVSIHAHELYDLFTADENQANENFLDKVIQVNGTIAEISLNQDDRQVILLQSNDPLFGISCTLEKTDRKISKGDVIHVKGICKGYLSDVVLTDCVIINP